MFRIVAEIVDDVQSEKSRLGNTRTEDGGLAKIVEIVGGDRLWCAITSYIDQEELPDLPRAELDKWLETAHTEIDQLIGKRVKVLVLVEG